MPKYSTTSLLVFHNNFCSGKKKEKELLSMIYSPHAHAFSFGGIYALACPCISYMISDGLRPPTVHTYVRRGDKEISGRKL